eukprot:CAMPEP_0113687722 /NCGR_PEP_ID=MMETSP0038_2-20120614/16105_1 /TAXON_ID=2898 /ORGANISM="Cryptomonas paramecium" /LENGTH=114 /DNA_ID=CAMNT_0000608391 /DNA_START=83 /DNA_END=427 /DNA_ORIENTATION=- /assembly_acc=CAM_ASM_000170
MTPPEMNMQIEDVPSMQMEDVSSIVQRFHPSVICRFERVALNSSRQINSPEVKVSAEKQSKRARKYRLAARQFKALAKYGDRMAKIHKKKSARRIGSEMTTAFDFAMAAMSNRG